MFTPAQEGQGARMILTFAAHKDKPNRVWLYNGYTEAIREFYPGLSSERIREMLGPEGSSGQGRYLERDELLMFLDAFDQLLTKP
jgi:hypothetical protein